MAEQDPQRAWVRTLSLFTVVIVSMVSYTGAGLGIGYLAWKHLGLPAWAIVIPGLAGLGLGMYRVYQVAQKL